jgi:hypothetical protein
MTAKLQQLLGFHGLDPGGLPEVGVDSGRAIVAARSPRHRRELLWR